MKRLFGLMSVAGLLLASATALAHGPVSAPKFGGIVTAVNDVEYELVAKPGSIAIYVENHQKKVATAGASAKAILLSGGEKTEVELAPAGDNKLEGKGSFKASPGTKVVTIVTLPGKAAATARFELK